MAEAQEAPAIEKSGWRVNCAAEGKCELGSTQIKAGRLIDRLLIYKLGNKTVVEYLVPLGVNLQRGVVLQIDGKRTFGTQSLYCEAPGCVGYAVISNDLLTQMKRGNMLKLAFSPHGSSQFFAFEHSLDGFTAQYAAFLAGKADSEKESTAKEEKPGTGSSPNEPQPGEQAPASN